MENILILFSNFRAIENFLHLSRSKSRDKAKERVERLKRERTIVQENLRREKTFAERSATESMEKLADRLQTEANGIDIF